MKTSIFKKTTILIALAATIVCFPLKGAKAQSVASNEGCPKQSEEQAPQADANQRVTLALTMGMKIHEFMQKGGYKVAIVSRAGSDLSDREFKNPTKQKYSHAGLLIPDLKGSWKFVHLLNTCGGPSSDIYEQGLGRFFAEDPFYYDFKITVPSVELQKKLEALANDTSVGPQGLARSLHWPKYSNIAYPFGLEYQNSNMWLLTVIASGQSGATSREAAQNYYKRLGFSPSKVHLKSFESLGGSIGIGLPPNVHMDAHPRMERLKGWLSFVAAEGVHDYLEKTDQTLITTEVCPDAGCNIPSQQLFK